MSDSVEQLSYPNWDPAGAGQWVRLRDNPARQGKTTGRLRQAGSYMLVEVEFGPNERLFKRLDLLEAVPPDDDMLKQLEAGRFGTPRDLRRVLTFEKIRGDLTNVFYSMESSKTDFYAHQFKPVLKFIESPVGRLLIADEVGLGKTIEAAYIWKELQARQDARRLLVVCPAMLRPKWQADLHKLFGIQAEIVTASDLLQKLSALEGVNSNTPMALIASLESIRPPADFAEDDQSSNRARFGRLLDQNPAADDFALIDLVVFDEAHYLRGSSTANNRLGRLLRDAARHTLLLTATPIQVSTDNLYQLLRLISPEEFYDPNVFLATLRANAPIIHAMRCLWQQPMDHAAARNSVSEALQTPYFKGDAVLDRVSRQLESANIDTSTRIELVRLLESRSLLGQFMSRSRKREVLEHKVERRAQTLTVRFTEQERTVYRQVSDEIRKQSIGKSGVSLFALIARQRQMASSLVAALEGWREAGVLEEMVWEDMGLALGLSKRGNEQAESAGDDLTGTASPVGDTIVNPNTVSLPILEVADCKYNVLKEFLTRELARNASEKFVLFAFFRGTLAYLRRRLAADGFSAVLIMGGMGDEIQDVLTRFAETGGPSVFLSSEVGSEGIDLQFCRFVINYDLPWNPMRVEQRIGRLDRLGQKADSIVIINFVVQDTIEDRILERLYDRIGIFRESIGDLENILGEMTETMLVDLLDPALSEEERERRAQASELALLNRRKQQAELEAEAGNLFGFSDYILGQINESKKRGRWLSGRELFELVDDYLCRKFIGTSIEAAEDGTAVKIRLSDAARDSLALFIAQARPATRTRLLQAPTLVCEFDPRQPRARGRDSELIDPTHPLIQWIRNDYEQAPAQLYRVSASKLGATEAAVGRGDYAYVVQRWTFRGLRTDKVLAFIACEGGSASPLDSDSSEALVSAASRNGEAFPNAVNVLEDVRPISAAAVNCERQLDEALGERIQDFEAENALRCNQQETSARKFAETRIADLKLRIERFRQKAQTRLIPMTEGLLHREEAQLRSKLARIALHRRVDIDSTTIGMGIVRVQ